MPAAAVIPAPIAYIKVVAVKKLVVELWARPGGPPLRWRVLPYLGRAFPPGEPLRAAFGWHAAGSQDVYLEKIRVFKAGARLHRLAWNKGIGPVVLFCWFRNRGND